MYNFFLMHEVQSRYNLMNNVSSFLETEDTVSFFSLDCCDIPQITIFHDHEDPPII